MNPSEPQPRRPSWVPQLFIITAALSASTGAGIVAMQSLPPVEVFGQRFEPPRLNLFPSEQSFPPRQGWPVYNGRTVEESGDGLGDEGDLGPVDDALDKAPERIYSPRDRGPSLRSLPVAPAEAPRPQELEMDQREDAAPSLEERPSFEPAIAPEADERPIRRSLGSDGDRPTPYNNSNPAAAPRSPIGGNGSGPTAPNNNSPDPAPAEAPRSSSPPRDLAPAPIAPPPPPIPTAPPPPPPISADPSGG